MDAGSDPRLIGSARRVRAGGKIVAANFDDALFLLLFLRKDVAKDAALFQLVMFASRSQFVQDTTRNKGGGYHFGSGMVELLPGMAAEVLDHADVLEAAILLKVVDALSTKRQVLLDLAVVGVPQLSIVAGVFDDDFVSSDRLHGVVQAIAGATRFAFNAIDGMGMDDSARGPGVAVHGRHGGDDLELLTGFRAERAEVIVAAVVLGLVSGDDPRPGDGILAQFHRLVTLR